MNQPLQADAVVIGGGMAGVSAAYELAADRRVVLLEAEGDLPIHTTGRSAALFLPAYGNDVIRALTAASTDDFPRLAGELGTPVLLTPRTVLYIAEPDVVDTMEHLLTAAAVETVTVDEAQRLFPALRPGTIAAASVDATGSDIDVLALHQGYRRGLRARGGELVKEARVLELAHDGSSWTATTATASYTAPLVVNAAGAWGDGIASLASVPQVGLSPLRRSAFIAPVDAPEGFRDWPFLMDSAERYYAKPEGDAILGSPADEDIQEPGDPRADEMGVAMALDHLREVTTFPLRSVRTQWAGLRTFAPDRSPVVGESAPGSGFWWFVGQGGYGIQMAPALARVLAGLVRGEQVADILPGTPLSAGDLASTRFAG